VAPSGEDGQARSLTHACSWPEGAGHRSGGGATKEGCVCAREHDEVLEFRKSHLAQHRKYATTFVHLPRTCDWRSHDERGGS
jgi:hypothetical protein